MPFPKLPSVGLVSNVKVPGFNLNWFVVPWARATTVSSAWDHSFQSLARLKAWVAPLSMRIWSPCLPSREVASLRLMALMLGMLRGFSSFVASCNSSVALLPDPPVSGFFSPLDAVEEVGSLPAAVSFTSSFFSSLPCSLAGGDDFPSPFPFFCCFPFPPPFSFLPSSCLPSPSPPTGVFACVLVGQSCCRCWIELHVQHRADLSVAVSQLWSQRHRWPCRQPASVSQNLQGRVPGDAASGVLPGDGVAFICFKAVLEADVFTSAVALTACIIASDSANRRS